MNEIGYRYSDNRSRRLFWSLPSAFTGNQVKSYGGSLTFTQHITAQPGARTYKDQDVLIIGNGITLFWTNPVDVVPDIPQVRMKEKEKGRRADGERNISNERVCFTFISDLLRSIERNRVETINDSGSTQCLSYGHDDGSFQYRSYSDTSFSQRRNDGDLHQRY